MLETKELDQITADDIRELVETKRLEDEVLDYKRDLPDISVDAKRKELLKDVSAFANSDGGHIIFGIDETEEGGRKSGVPQSITGIDDVSVDPIERQWSAILRSGLDPGPIPRPTMTAINMGGTKSVVVLRILKSANGPHMVKEGNVVFKRHRRVSEPMNTSELRIAFGEPDEAEQRLVAFRQSRLERLMRNEGSIGPLDDRCAVIHIVPLFASRSRNLDLGSISKSVGPWLAQGAPGVVSTSHFWNADGLLVAPTPRDGKTGELLQFFRDGRLEVVLSLSSRASQEEIPLDLIRRFLTDSIETNAPLLRRASGSSAILVTLSITNTRGANVARSFNMPAIDRAHLFLMSVVFDADSSSDAGDALRPIVDHLWQAFGFASAPKISVSSR